MLADGEFVHITQCRRLVTNGSNHWILRQPDQVSQTGTMARGMEVLFAATSDHWLPQIGLRSG